MSGLQLTLTAAEAGAELEFVDGELVASAVSAVSATALSPSPPLDPSGLQERNLFGEAQRIAARAATATTRRQYAAIFRSFGDWLAAELGRPPVVGDLDADVIAGYGRHLALAGGCGGRPAAPATARVYLSMLRALERELGLAEEVDGVRIPRHEPGPPETLTDVDYANLLRVPDRRTLAGKRDHALLRVLGGLRLAVGRATRPARSRSAPLAVKRQALSPVRPRQGRVRARSPVPEATQQALEAWTAVHPLARGAALLDRQPLFVRLGRHTHEEPLPLSAVAVHRIVRRHCLAAGVPDRLAHPHAFRAYWATRCLEAGVPVHEVSARLGHVDLRTTARHAAPRPERVDEIAEVLDRHHQAARRAGRGA